MTRREIKKSLRIDSEPVLRWPKSSARLERLEGLELSYTWMDRTIYTLKPKKRSCVDMVIWDAKKVTGERDIFAESPMQPNGLLALAKLDGNPSLQNICEWVSQNGPLGFRPSSNPIEKDGHFIPYNLVGDVPIYAYEPIDCIRSAARRAANVIALWSALKHSYRTDKRQEKLMSLKAIITFIESDPIQPIEGIPVHYRVRVNGEPRSSWPIPKNVREWRRLTNILLAEYIQEHLAGDVRLAVGVQGQNKDEEKRYAEPSPDWNLKPLWRIQSALAAYYVELLMVMRRFRSCKTCGKDISHQRDKSLYCSAPSTCRSKQWHRQAASKKKTP